MCTRKSFGLRSIKKGKILLTYIVYNKERGPLFHSIKISIFKKYWAIQENISVNTVYHKWLLAKTISWLKGLKSQQKTWFKLPLKKKYKRTPFWWERKFYLSEHR